jgi:DNA repair protein RecO (recombination protein O)
LLTVYTAERGKLRLLAKGVRKTTSRKAGHVELFMQICL